MSDPGGRRDELAAGARARPASASRTPAPRPAATPSEITLVVVTKFFPAADVRLLADLGVRHVGENRHQEAVAQGGRVRRPRPDLALHRRPAEQQGGRRRVVRRRRAVPRPGQAGRAASAAAPQERGRDLEVLLQVSLDPPDAAGRAGAAPERRRRRSPSGSLEADGPRPARRDGGGARWAATPARRSTGWPRSRPACAADAPAATWVSAGMSGDLEAGRPARCDTPADWLGGPRSEAHGQVVSEVGVGRPRRPANTPREQRKPLR